MKSIIILFLTIFFCNTSFASKVFEIHFLVKDAYTEEPVKNAAIEVSFEKKGVFKQLGIGQTDTAGIVVIPNISGAVIHIKVTSPHADFANKEFDYFTNRGKDCHLKLMMYPSESQLERWLMREDQNYGRNDEGSLSEDANDMDYVFGCLKENYTPAFYDSTATSTATLNYFRKNLHYPLESSEQSEQGRVFARFIIEKDGKLSHIEIIHGVSPCIDQEAIRLLRSMDLWSPAKCSGQRIRTRAELMINFELEY